MIKILEPSSTDPNPDGTQIDLAGLEQELRAGVRGEIRFEAEYRAMYSTDASNYRQVPLAVVLPKDAADVEAAVAACRRYGAPVLSRGGGTSLAGETCNVAVVLDFSKHMNRVLEIDYENKFAWVEPGCVLDDLRDLAEKKHLTFGPDPSTHNRNTLGGMIGNNSCGVHAQMAGKVEENIEEMEILTYDGLRMMVGAVSDEELEAIILQGGRKGEIYAQLKTIRDQYAGRIRERFPDIPRRVSGFALNELLPESGFNVARALVGTEGTCVTVLRAKCRLVESPRFKALGILGFDDIATAADHVPFCNEFGPIALEGMDETLFQHMHEKGKNPHEQAELFPQGSAWLIVQFGAGTQEEAEAKARELVTSAKHSHLPLKGSRVLANRHQMQEIWDIREAGLGVNAKIPNQPEFYPGWEDSAVAVEHLGEYLREFQEIMQRYGYYASIYGHFGQACVHCRINFDLFTKEGIETYRKFAYEMAHVCTKYKGSLSGEHGDGQSRAELLPIMYGDELVQAFWEFKTAWDPHNRMNPGKVVRPFRIDENLRWGTGYEPWEPKTYFTFEQDHGSFAYAANRCVGAGVCRKHDKGTMCPSYMATREEMHSTRGRARMLFEMLQGDPVHGGWQNESVKEALDWCLACKGCKHECPVNVDMATYKAEFRAHYYERKQRPLFMYVFGYMFWLAKLGSLRPSIANFVAQEPLLGRIGKALLKISPQRKIPMFADRTFRSWFRQRPIRNRGKQKVILWADTWNNHFFPSTGQAAVEVLEDAGFQVVLPPHQICCGRPLYDYGFLDQAKRQLLAILEDLRPMIREGICVVGLEPSCMSVFKDEMHNLLGSDKDAERLEQQCFVLDGFLQKKVPQYNPPKLRRKAVMHQHCHHKSVLDPNAEQHVFQKMELEFEKLESGCCGMAGAFGFEEDNYDVSMKCGERVLLPKVREADPHAIVIADGFSCREQIQQTTSRQALHPAHVIKMAIDDRGFDRDDRFPERRYLADPETKRREVLTRGYRLLAVCALGCIATGSLWSFARRNKN